MTRLLPVISIALAGCAHAAPIQRNWDHMPLDLVLSGALSNCQVDTMHSAVEWMEARLQRDVFTIRMVPADHPLANGILRYGVVAVTNDPLSKPENMDETYLVSDLDGRMFSAEIRVGACDLRSYCHELAHALGLDDLAEPDNLMSDGRYQSMELTHAQVEAILIGTVTRLAITKPIPRESSVQATVKP